MSPETKLKMKESRLNYVNTSVGFNSLPTDGDATNEGCIAINAVEPDLSRQLEHCCTTMDVPLINGSVAVLAPSNCKCLKVNINEQD